MRTGNVKNLPLRVPDPGRIITDDINCGLALPPRRHVPDRWRPGAWWGERESCFGTSTSQNRNPPGRTPRSRVGPPGPLGARPSKKSPDRERGGPSLTSFSAPRWPSGNFGRSAPTCGASDIDGDSQSARPYGTSGKARRTWINSITGDFRNGTVIHIPGHLTDRWRPGECRPELRRCSRKSRSHDQRQPERARRRQTFDLFVGGSNMFSLRKQKSASRPASRGGRSSSQSR